MEICYDGALVMPKNYAVVSEEEMTYVDGGGVVQVVAYNVVEFGVDCVFNAALGGGSISCVKAVIKSLGTTGFKKTLCKALTKWVAARVANKIAAAFSKVITGFASFSVGGAVAEWLDRKDGCNDDQIYFSRIFS